jgi:hypothetical protein
LVPKKSVLIGQGESLMSIPRGFVAGSLRALLIGVLIASCNADDPRAGAPAEPVLVSGGALPLSAGRLRAAFSAQAPRLLGGPRAFVAASDGFAVLEPPSARRSLGEIGLRLPSRGEDAIAIRSGALAISVHEIGAAGEGVIAGSAVMYPSIGGESLWAATANGFEEWLHLDASSTLGERIAGTWSIEGASVRRAGEGAEIVDAAGIARIRVTTPIAYAKSGRAVPVRLEISGAQITVVVEAEAAGEEVLVDPLWSSTGAMASARAEHTATLLASGKVLIAGCSGLPQAELYDPSTGTWSLTGPMTVARCHHTATLLSNGKVLAAGGQVGSAMVASTEIYDPLTGTWAPDAPLGGVRGYHTATRLLSGKVLVYGGKDGLGDFFLHIAAEVYDPVSHTWSTLPPSFNNSFPAVTGHTATLLPSGNVYIAGGSWAFETVLDVLYDPVVGAWTTLGLFNGVNQAATLLPNGKVLLTGGTSGGPLSAAAGLYDPTNDTYALVSPMLAAREDHTATLLPGGKVLVAGGLSPTSPESAELYDPAADTWSSAGAMYAPCDRATATLLANGDVLLTGGVDVNGAVASAALYHSAPASSPGDPCVAGSDCGSGFCADGVCCATACNAGPCDACGVAAGATVDGTCALFTGVLCNDGDACTPIDTCQSGVCSGSSPLPCGPLEECHSAGTCAPVTGQCSNPPSPDGSLCAGGACVGGACVIAGGASSSSEASAGASSSAGVGGGASASSSGGGGASASSGTGVDGGGSSSVTTTGGGSLYRSGSCSQVRGGAAIAPPAWLAVGLLLLRRRRARVAARPTP